MHLTQLIYTSTISDSFVVDDIHSIMESAKRNNAEAGLTGLLYFNRQYFLQCLEGGRDQVNKAYNTILSDSRHKDIVILSYQEISEREFPSWQMGYLPESDLTKSAYIHFTANYTLDPYSISGSSAHGLILELKGILKQQKSVTSKAS
ncbi:BLUF domain-containing protein [Marinomonas agarivorans]|nr:BLUF domain-containing protein [Marinomonas agarivorans]